MPAHSRPDRTGHPTLRNSRTSSERNRRLRRVTALAVVAALALAACTGNGQPLTTDAGSGTGTTAADGATGSASPNGGTGGTTDDGAPQFSPADIPDAAAIIAAGKDLPADPVAAASALVDHMFSDEPAQATAATGELLRRAGLPLGSGAGPMVAMPSTYVITNAQIGVELLPELTQQARDGRAFDLSQVQALLTHLGIPKGQFTDAELIGTLAEWGKGDKDPAESRTAGAAERALAEKHGQLLAASDVPDAATVTALRDKPESLPIDEYQRLIDNPIAITLDPVQVLLLVAHMAGAVTDDPVIVQLPATKDRAPAEDAPHGFRREETTGPCSALQTQLDTEVGKFDKGAAKAILQNVLGEAVEKRFGEVAASRVEKGFAGYDQLTDVLSYLAFTMALQFTVAPVGKKTTHFLHDESAHANDVSFLARAWVVALVPAKYVDCFAIAGIDIPTSKELKDMKIIWSLPNGRVGLKPAVVGGRQFDVPIDLNDKGMSTVQTTPRRESNPPKNGEKRPQSTVIQTVRAELDKNYLEAHIGEIALMVFGELPAAAVAVAFKVIVAMLKEAGLPAETLEFPVTYHGSNVYRIFGDGELSLLGFANVPLAADLYSCNGAEGPWKGSITIKGSADYLLKAVGESFNIDTSGSGEVTAKANFMLNPQTAQEQTFDFTDKYGLVVQLDEAAVDGGLQTTSGTGTVAERMRRIGWASWKIGGQDVRALAGMMGGFMSHSLDLPVEAVPGDLRCSGTAIYQNDFD